jgi:hypothetical protein
VNGGARAEFSDFAYSRWPRLYRLGYGLTGDRGLAEDLAQTALANAYAAWPRVRRADDPDAYLRRILLNSYRSGFRKRRVAEELSDSVPDAAISDPVSQHGDRAAALDSVIKRGRAVMIRRRVVAAVAVIVVAAVAVAVPKLAHNLSEPPPSSPGYQVTVHPPAKNSSKRLIAYGRLKTNVNNVGWKVTGWGSGRGFHLHWHMYGVWHVYQFGRYLGDVHGGSFDGQASGSLAIPVNPVNIYELAAAEPYLFAFTVRADVRYLIVSLSNRQSVTLRPVAILGRARPGLVAIAVPAQTSITQISAYSAAGEIAYTAPFGAKPAYPTPLNSGDSGDFEILRWLQPDQPALPRPATYKIGHGSADRTSWTQYVYVGPWGTCFVAPTASYWCYPVTAGELTHRAAAVRLFTSYLGSTIGWSVIAAKPSVGYIVLRTSNDDLVGVRTYSVDGAKLATVFLGRNNIDTGWIAYSPTGKQLASGSFG